MAKYGPRYDEPPDDPRDLRSRTDARNERKRAEARLLETAERLSGLSDRVIARLGLPEHVGEALGEARRIKRGSARNRALRSLRIALRACEPAFLNELARALDGHH
jgi:ribosomal 50S subunit-associated protein YjgA (DUF615 family)